VLEEALGDEALVAGVLRRVEELVELLAGPGAEVALPAVDNAGGGLGVPKLGEEVEEAVVGGREGLFDDEEGDTALVAASGLVGGLWGFVGGASIGKRGGGDGVARATVEL
jgi:hypothetical protein